MKPKILEGGQSKHVCMRLSPVIVRRMAETEKKIYRSHFLIAAISFKNKIPEAQLAVNWMFLELHLGNREDGNSIIN